MQTSEMFSAENAPASFVQDIDAGAAGSHQYLVRYAELDKVRGFAVLLMIVDHVLHFAQIDSIARHTLTRAALPLFCLVSGFLARRGRKWSRISDVAFVGLLSLVSWYFGFNRVGQPDVCILLAFGLALLPYLGNPFVLALCIIQPVAWPCGWTGYEPGTVFALLAVGVQLIGRDDFAWGKFLPGFLALLGRWPLFAYFAHLAALGCFLLLLER